ncbi:M43 family zinc metalloprotease [Flavobacteriales bacterium]|nr:M43 family zinc metalloprotease [Flavobacteriales bacterium]
MKNFKNLVLLFTTLGLVLNAQNLQPCTSVERYHDYLQQHPEKAVEAEQMKKDLFNNFKNISRKNRTTRIIPVVFHIMHDGQNGNISKEQIDDQIRILNEDFSRTNSDADNTPSAFASVAANTNIEFRLANFNPQGNCSQGVTRNLSNNSYEARDNVKSEVRWNTSKYLNIWVVNSIEGGDENSIVLGFAQFPWWGSASTDGIVIRHDVVGTIGSASGSLGSSNNGRTLSHEVGHYLGLRHIWGDNYCGDDGIDDTPTAADANSGCPNFPYNAGSCTGNATNGEMYMNYMDYTNGSCQNMFSQGQSELMNYVLDENRSSLITSSNISATGVNDMNYQVCSPIAEFYATDLMICQGERVSFIDNSWNGEPDDYSWSFEGGTPATSVSSDPSIQFLNAGIYDVSLNVSNESGEDTKTEQNLIFVSPLEAQYNSWQYFDNFEDESRVSEDWLFFNDQDNGWEWSNDAGYSSKSALTIQNRAGNAEGSVDYIISPSFNPAAMASASPRLYFDYAYSKLISSSNDDFKVYISRNCGETWTLRFSKSGVGLETTPTTVAALIPSDDQWQNVSIALGAFANAENVRVKFQFTAGGGNNFWLDNVNIGDINSIESLVDQVDLNVYPNPGFGNFSIDFSLVNSGNVKIDLMDIKGSTISLLLEEYANSGEFNLNYNLNGLSRGVYFIKMTVNGMTSMNKLVVQ